MFTIVSSSDSYSQQFFLVSELKITEHFSWSNNNLPTVYPLTQRGTILCCIYLYLKKAADHERTSSIENTHSGAIDGI